MNVIPMFMKCPVELPMYPSLGLSPNAFQHAVRSGGKPRALLLHKYLSVDVKHTRLHLHVSAFVQMGWQVGYLLDKIDSDSRLVWDVPGGNIEGLFPGEETVRKSESWKGGFTDRQWVERRLHELGADGSSRGLSSCSIPGSPRKESSQSRALPCVPPLL